jgi:hypothetical protein
MVETAGQVVELVGLRGLKPAAQLARVLLEVTMMEQQAVTQLAAVVRGRLGQM